MKLSRASVGLAVRAAREAAGLTLQDLAGITGLHASRLSRTESGLRDIQFTEFEAVAAAVKISAEELRTLAETLERDGAGAKQAQRDQLEQELNQLQRLALEAAIEARAQLPK